MTGNPIHDLAAYAQNQALQKVANIGYMGGQQPVPFATGNHGNGLYDPDATQASASVLSQVRSDNNHANMADGQVTGTNLVPYAQYLPPYQTVQNLTNVPMYQKAANDQGLSPLQQELTNMGLFQKWIPSHQDCVNLVENTRQKSASDTESLLVAMLNQGAITDPDIISELTSEV